MTAQTLHPAPPPAPNKATHPGPGHHPHPAHLYWPLFLAPFGALHVAALVGPFWSGVTTQAVICCAVLYFVRIFGMAAGYHRYFSHRTFKTSRVGQAVLALLAQSTAQKGVLWWAAHHRAHHKYSDRPGDPHSPTLNGFWYAHFGWVSDDADATDFSRVQDFMKYPEIRFIDRHWYIAPVALACVVTYFLGLPGLFIGFCLSTVLTFHGTFFVNSLAHVWGSRRYATKDTSRNNVWLTFVTLGEGWHNNHHHYMGSAKQGFVWWEIDPTYMVLKALSWTGVIWDLRLPPASALQGPLAKVAPT